MSVEDRLIEKQIGKVKGSSGETHTLSVKDNVVIVRSSDGKTTLSTT